MDKTVPYSTRIDLEKVGIKTVKVLYVQAAYPKVGVSLGSKEISNMGD